MQRGEEGKLICNSCVFAEMLVGKPILAGESDPHQLELIWDLMGSPNDDVMPGWKQLPGGEHLNPRPRPGNLQSRFREYVYQFTIPHPVTNHAQVRLWCHRTPQRAPQIGLENTDQRRRRLGPRLLQNGPLTNATRGHPHIRREPRARQEKVPRPQGKSTTCTQRRHRRRWPRLEQRHRRLQQR